ncbi:nitroreductase family protein [Clostridium pasteurianum]|uniref:Nitroreductase n=1 Tax=Clostridium pasteurianum BC1 TaxID=86416 RepID=R4K347_CLOPA|nr:nitroreductase family protein [Clostridium pasteurianum]AGK96166.1 nitroreductase [Clostridium pasteurianum BC1]
MTKEIKNRRSIRKYTDKSVEEEKIIQLIDSARLAPSGMNAQPWHFVVVKSQSTREKLVEAAHNQKWMLSAPVFILCIADIAARIDGTEVITVDENSPQVELKGVIGDTSIAAEHIQLEANNLGLGTCWVGWYDQKDIRPILNIPSDKYVVGIVTVGYAAESPEPRPRKKIEEILHNEKWRTSFFKVNLFTVFF